MPAKSERLTILSEAEQFALYGLPDFDDRQRGSVSDVDTDFLSCFIINVL